MEDKQVYLFEKDGSYKIVNTPKRNDRIEYYKYPDTINPCWNQDGDYIHYKEPEKDWLEIKTLRKIVSIDSYSLQKGLVDGASLIKDNLNYGQCTGSYEKAMGFGREFRLELNYAIVKDSPLHTIITELEKSSRSSNDKDVEHQKDVNVLVDKIRKLEKENSVFSEHRDANNEALDKYRYEVRELRNGYNFIQNIIEKPNMTFLYSVFMNWIKVLFKNNK